MCQTPSRLPLSPARIAFLICGATSLSSPGGAGTISVSSLPDLTFMAGDVDQHQEHVHVAAVAPGGVLVQVNRRVGQVPDAVAVAVALPHEVGVLGDILAAEVGIQLAPVTRARACGMPWDLSLPLTRR